VATDLLHPSGPFVRAVRIEPNDPRCAALTLVYTGFPGIVMHAGLLHDSYYPPCGCDACDSTWGSEADDLERQVLAVACGRFREGIDEARDPLVEFSFEYADGSSSGQVRAVDLPAERVESAWPVLRSLRDGWAPWPLL
jgi:hypothetical protein